MGDDKGLLLFRNKTWAQIAKEKLSPLSTEVLLSVNSNQFEKYRLVFKNEELVDDNTELDIAGPLLGLLSVHLKFPKENLLVLACDMLDMQTFVLEQLIHKYVSDKHFEAIAFTSHGQVEPLCAVYSANGLSRIYSAYQNKSLTKHSMMHVLEILDTDFIPAPESWNPYFKNFNLPADLP